MDTVRILDVKKTILEDNDADAAVLRSTLQEEKTLYLNLMSSPGSGKTSTLIQTINALKDEISIGVMEADIDSDVDAKTIIEKTGVPSVQLHTQGMCHLDADMSRQGIGALREAADEKNLDLVILENVGNLVCPAEFDTGAHINAAILSITEGHDKPLKYPLMFELCDVVLINKIDAVSVFNFDFEKAEEYIRRRNPKAEIFRVSAKTGEGISDWANWLKEKVWA